MSMHDWINLNVDGDSREFRRELLVAVVVLGLICAWVLVFNKFLGEANSVSAELWSLVTYLGLTWNASLRKV